MRRILLLAFCVVTAFSVRASHIVGGEFEMLYQGTNPINGNHLYSLSLILYYDVINANVGTRDPWADVRIFRKRDNAIMEDQIRLFLSQTTRVEYFQPECSNGIAITTDRLYYTYRDPQTQLPALFQISPDRYADSQGYYLAWERCCRNDDIKNIFSEDPSNAGGGIYAGQVFYLEFPPLQKENGEAFINSSPTLFPPLSDYACPGSLYYVDFAGSDPDGDSLVYSMVTPLNTKSGDALPPAIPPSTVNLPRPGPYPPVIWQNTFGLTNIVGGDPDLKISLDGLLTVVPKLQGLFVFSVRCEEFRDKVKIGEVRRDFQLLVLAECKTAEDPVIVAKPKGANDSEYKKDLILQPGDGLCTTIRVTDPDSQNPDDGNSEDVRIRAIPLGFKGNVSDVLPDISSATIINGGFVEFDVCFPSCPYTNGPYKIGIIASDNACPLPRLDTAIVFVNVPPPDNTRPKFQRNLVNEIVPERNNDTEYSSSIIGTDANNDKLVLTMLPTDFDFAQYGFGFRETLNVDGRVEGELTWNTRCNEIDFSERTEFEIKFLLNDLDECEITPSDTMVFNLKIDLANIHPPEIRFNNINVRDTTVTLKIFKMAKFEIQGEDEDDDFLILSGKGVDFDMGSYGATFPGDTGIPTLNSEFNWPINCNKVDLDVKDEFAYQFIVVDDQNRCGYYLADTLNVTVKVEPPDNEAPLLKIGGSSDDVVLSYTVGDPITINLVGTDTDVAPTDLLTLKLFDVVWNNFMPENYSFQSTPAKSSVNGVFSWVTDCSIFEHPTYENQYQFYFSVTDDRCHNIKGDTSTLRITIKDRDQEPVKFIPPNFITPNNDGCNDYFAMEEFDLGNCGDVQVVGLPKDNCQGRFVRINIYNRWGMEVFSSSSRNFRWYAENISVGVYFYTLVYSNKEYKGTVTVRL